MNKISYSRQSIDESDIESVIACLRSDYLTQGPKVKEFETLFSDACSSKYSLSFTNATAALHTACLALGLSKDDIVWTSPITFVASANCARMCGAQVDFVDIDGETFNLCPKKLAEKFESTPVSKHPKIIIPVHFSGLSCNMKEIKQIADKYNCKIIEDASHAVGAKYKGTQVGSCEYSDVSVFSFHPVKIITTGEGGMLTTNSLEVIEKSRRIASHGIVKDSSKNEFLEKEPWRYKQSELGYNFRLTDIQSALGVSQLRKLPKFHERRLEIVKKYSTEFINLPITLPLLDLDSSWHLFVIQLEVSEKRLSLYKYLLEHNIYTQVHYVPVHLQPYYKSLGFNVGDFPTSENYYSRCLSLPVFPTMSDEELDYVIDLVKAFFK